MKTLMIGVSVAAMLSGCQSLQYLGGIDGVPASAVKGDQRLKIEALNSDVSSTLLKDPDPALREVLSECKNKYAAGAGVITSILVSSVGKFLFDAWVERERANLERYKKLAAPSPYSDTVLVSPKFAEARCIVLVRETASRDAAGRKTDSSPGLIVVLYADRYVGKDGMRAFTFTPKYVKANNAVAFVARETPTLAIAISMSLKGVLKQANGMPGIVQLGENVLSVEGISVGPQSEASCGKEQACWTSGFFPIPPVDAGTLALTISVAERGSLPTANLEIADLELKALKDAVGPGIRDALKEWYK